MMKAISVILIFSLGAILTLAVNSICQSPTYCSCGNKGKTISICVETNNTNDNICKMWSRCKRCHDGLNKCLQCEDGFEDPLCSAVKSQMLKLRRKRQSHYSILEKTLVRSRSVRSHQNAQRYCSSPYSPMIGSIRCIYNDQQKTCVGKCLPDYKFENFATASEITLTCQGGVWSPLNAFPSCKPQGQCDLIVNGIGNFNCTTGMEGIRCDVNCISRYRGRYFCFPGKKWDPSLPDCVIPKVIPNKGTCMDPGFISNGFRKHTDGSESNVRQSFNEGDSVVYVCHSDEFVLQGSSLLTCKSDGTWSNSLPKCIISRGVMCPDPGQVANADRLNSDGSTSAGIQQYKVGQSVVYSCHTGFALQSRSLITCLATGKWSSRKPYCNPIAPPSSIVRITPVGSLHAMFCDNPGKIFYGKVEVIPPAEGPRSAPIRLTENAADYPEGTQLDYSCDDGFILQGSHTLRCQASGFWSSNPPVCVADCGVSFALTTRKIHNGNKTFPGEWPWVVAISVQENNTTRLTCGGVVLNSQTVMTAAHCLTGAPRYILYFGKHRRSNKEDDADVLVGQSTQIIIHPEFSNTTFDSDIGLIKFQPPITFSPRVQPICLPTPESTARNMMTGAMGYVTGWGLTERQVLGEELMVAHLPVLTNQACLESYRKQNLILPLTRTMFCAGFPTAQQSACSGDSGSPLVFYDNIEGRYTVEGIVSFGAEGQCGLPGRYTVFTRVYNFIPWILDYL